jgi:hypothetical protein
VSVSSMIETHGKSVTRRRITTGKTAMGGVAPVGIADAPITMLIQVSGGGTGMRYGSERARYSATGYCVAGTDILDGDLIIDGTKQYRIESLHVPDERPIGDDLSYIICGLEEDRNAP